MPYVASVNKRTRTYTQTHTLILPLPSSPPTRKPHQALLRNPHTPQPPHPRLLDALCHTTPKIATVIVSHDSQISRRQQKAKRSQASQRGEHEEWVFKATCVFSGTISFWRNCLWIVAVFFKMTRFLGFPEGGEKKKMARNSRASQEKSL